MSAYDFDLLTIGAGSGGVACSRRAGACGARVAICEIDRVGGTCVLRGCVPKKLLVYGAQFAAEFADAAGFGWTVPVPDFDWAALIQQKDRELSRLNQVYVRLLHEAGCQILMGQARVTGPHTVEVTGPEGRQTYTAANILLATGSWPVLPPIPGIEHAITSNEALSLPALPRRLCIIGGGYVAVEFAGIFNALGVEVTMAVRGDTVLRGFDQDLRAHLTQELTRRGVVLRCDTLVRSLAREPDGSLCLLTTEDEMLTADVVLVAAGRAPHTAGLGLPEVGVALRENGAVIVDAYGRTSVPTLFAVGDCTDRLNLTPVAIAEGRAVAETLFGKGPTPFDPAAVPTAVFSQPPLATVGLTEEEARARYGAVDVYVANFRPLKHTLSGREERTLMKLVVDRDSDRVLGCHMVGPDAPEIIQCLAVALTCGATKAQFDATVALHPTAAEEFVTMRAPRR